MEYFLGFQHHKKPKSKVGDENHISQDSISRLCHVNKFCKQLVNTITQLANAEANHKLPYLNNFLVMGAVPMRKKDSALKPVGFGDMARRIVLKVIEVYCRKKVLSVCIYQLSKGITSGCKRIMHELQLFWKIGSTDPIMLLERSVHRLCLVRQTKTFRCTNT